MTGEETVQRDCVLYGVSDKVIYCASRIKKTNNFKLLIHMKHKEGKEKDMKGRKGKDMKLKE